MSVDLSPAALVRMHLLNRHMVALREGDEAKRARLSSLITELEWACPEAVAELGAWVDGILNPRKPAPPSGDPWVLLLNDMRSPKVEIQTAVVKAETREELEVFLQSERVEPYRTDDRWGKCFRQGGPLEWFNLPWPEEGGGIRHADELEDWLVKETPWLHELEAQFAPAGGGA